MSQIRTILLFSVAVILGLFIQGTFVRSFAPGAYAPDIILILIVMVALSAPTVWGLLAAFILGLLADFSTALYVGPNAAGAVVAFGFVVFCSSKVFADKWLAISALTFVASCLKSLICLLMFGLYAGVNFFSIDYLNIALVEAVGSGLLAPIVMKLLYIRRASRNSGYGYSRDIS